MRLPPRGRGVTAHDDVDPPFAPVVALVANHAKNGFFIFRPGQGYEYVLMITLVSGALGALGAGSWSVDRAVRFGVHEWAGPRTDLPAGPGVLGRRRDGIVSAG